MGDVADQSDDGVSNNGEVKFGSCFVFVFLLPSVFIGGNVVCWIGDNTVLT